VTGKHDFLLNSLGISFECWVVFDFYEKPLVLVLKKSHNDFGFTKK
jgi:hypothetical protein